MQNPYRKRGLKQFGGITLVGLVIGFSLCPQCLISFTSLMEQWESIVLSIVYSYVLGYGCTFILIKLEKKYSWLENPGKKFLLHFISLAAFSFIVSAILFYIFAYTMFEGKQWLTISQTMQQARLPALIAITISAFFTGVDFLKNWKKEAVRAERLEKEKIATQYESLKNQVNPHFLFNSLNALSELVYENQELAVKYIRQLSQVYRYVLDSRNMEVASLREELEFLESFIFLQKIRFGNNLIVNMKVEKIDTGYILPLSLQILFENAIKHNVVSEADPLTIQIRQEGNYLVIQNKLNKKKSSDPGTGIGLENIKMRYKYLTEEPMVVEEKGGKFSVKIPILTEKP